MKGKKVFFLGEYCRKPRVSLLCFLGIGGIVDIFSTNGTFDRSLFIQSIREFATQNSNVTTYPGVNSIWVMDGASIHCHPNIVHYLRSIGIVAIYLPAYCPFFNPIEIVFGLVKKKMRRYYGESPRSDMKTAVVESFQDFLSYDMKPIFKKCGYTSRGFDPAVAFDLDLKEYGYI
jgi:hypothetical protein